MKMVKSDFIEFCVWVKNVRVNTQRCQATRLRAPHFFDFQHLLNEIPEHYALRHGVDRWNKEAGGLNLTKDTPGVYALKY